MLQKEREYMGNNGTIGGTNGWTWNEWWNMERVMEHGTSVDVKKLIV